jgi:hypothetical protein
MNGIADCVKIARMPRKSRIIRGEIVLGRLLQR